MLDSTSLHCSRSCQFIESHLVIDSIALISRFGIIYLIEYIDLRIIKHCYLN